MAFDAMLLASRAFTMLEICLCAARSMFVRYRARVRVMSRVSAAVAMPAFRAGLFHAAAAAYADGYGCHAMPPLFDHNILYRRFSLSYFSHADAYVYDH